MDESHPIFIKKTGFHPGLNQSLQLWSPTFQPFIVSNWEKSSKQGQKSKQDSSAALSTRHDVQVL